jgi:hypothetical protein
MVAIFTVLPFHLKFVVDIQSPKIYSRWDIIEALDAVMTLHVSDSCLALVGSGCNSSLHYANSDSHVIYILNIWIISYRAAVREMWKFIHHILNFTQVHVICINGNVIFGLLLVFVLQKQE